MCVCMCDRERERAEEGAVFYSWFVVVNQLDFSFIPPSSLLHVKN